MGEEFLQHRSDKLSSGRVICHPTRRRKMGRRGKKKRRRKGGEEKKMEKKIKRWRRKGTGKKRRRTKMEGSRGEGVLNKHLQLYFFERQRAHVPENRYNALPLNSSKDYFPY